ncbi:cell division cycle 25 homolog d isoform X2 [Silurus meridionalis]|uniref:cell division cycle 25 homolog d isoform X2 n=1 Tax=Silurus meridionalis TaxID=175797 RepID=UPI001EEC3095|nr:cell division cycle 25 homolog d isoform X2 [Silurus meridionalis]
MVRGRVTDSQHRSAVLRYADKLYMEMLEDQQDPGWSWSMSPVSELSICMQKLRCEDSQTPRRRLDLTPELSSSDRGQTSGQQTLTVSRWRTRGCRGVTSPEQTSNTTHSLSGGTEDDEDDEDDKENTSMRKKVRVRLFSSSSPEDQVQSVRRSKRQFRSSPAEGELETLDSESLMLFQRLRCRRNPEHTLIPESSDTDHFLIGDFSQHHVLPVEKMNHQDLHCVSAQTVASLLQGEFSSVVEEFLIIDCRYPYEYGGGHIKGAVNLYTESQMFQAFIQGLSNTTQVSPAGHHAPDEASAVGRRGSRGETPGGVKEGASSRRKLIVFHCEFSSERGPRLCHYLRELDRTVNAQTYPHLFYPELYLLQGGYKLFYSCCPELCEPCAYVPMRHRDFREQLHCFSRKTQRHRHRRPIRSQLLTLTEGCVSKQNHKRLTDNQ